MTETAAAYGKRRRVKSLKCPACGQQLTRNRTYEDWYECTTENCELIGTEAFEWNWRFLSSVIDKKKVKTVLTKRDTGSFAG